jgi:SAM-dependent methyltransferase
VGESEISEETVRDLYNDLEGMWADPWHAHTRKCLENYLRKLTPLTQGGKRVLHIGSAGDDYGLRGTVTCHVDIAEKKLNGIDGGVIGNAHRLPILPNSIDFCTCVGSVINYCRAVEVLLEIAHVLKPGGYLALEFESSESWEYFGSDVFGKGIASTRTFYAADPDCKLWVYSPKFIEKIILKYGLIVKNEERSHILSSLVYRINPNEEFASKFSSLDPISAKIPVIKNGSSNVIWLCQKQT